MAEIPVNETEIAEVRTEFMKAATWHGDLSRAETLLTQYPWLADHDIYTAAITGHAAAVRKFLEADPGNATAVSGPYGATALVYLGLSKYLRLKKDLSGHFMQAATALLEAGADAHAGFWTTGQYPEFETALYGAAGVAHHAALTRLLLKYGADPNDEEAVYHSPETHDNDALKLLVETGRLTENSRTLMLIRKHDWHDYEGVKYLLQHVSPNSAWNGKRFPVHHALERENGLAIIRLLLDHGVDFLQEQDGLTAIARAAHGGRSDVLKLLEERGIDWELQGVNRLIAACTMGDAAQVNSIAQKEPQWVKELVGMGGILLAKFSSVGNLPGVQQLTALGVDVSTPFTEGDSYFDIPPGSLAIHIAAWKGQDAIVQYLIGQGFPVDLPDGKGRTPLVLAIRACTDSYWMERCTTGSIEALLEAGASVDQIPFPTGHQQIDELLKKYKHEAT